VAKLGLNLRNKYTGALCIGTPDSLQIIKKTQYISNTHFFKFRHNHLFRTSPAALQLLPLRSALPSSFTPIYSLASLKTGSNEFCEWLNRPTDFQKRAAPKPSSYRSNLSIASPPSTINKDFERLYPES